MKFEKCQNKNFKKSIKITVFIKNLSLQHQCTQIIIL